MARPLRIEFSGALYHVTARGNAQQDIYLTDDDKLEFLSLLQRACERYHWLCHAYCLMTNHYHLLIETHTPTLSKGMKYLNGTYTQAFNRRHKRVGHVFQGRFKGILVEKDSYLLELSRYIVLNPVRAHMVRSVKDEKKGQTRNIFNVMVESARIKMVKGVV
jgi:putative transposase